MQTQVDLYPVIQPNRVFKGMKICREMSSTFSGAIVKKNLGRISFHQTELEKLFVTNQFLYFKDNHVLKLY